MLRTTISYYWHRYIKWIVRTVSLAKMFIILSPIVGAMMEGNKFDLHMHINNLDGWEVFAWVALLLSTFIT